MTKRTLYVPMRAWRWSSVAVNLPLDGGPGVGFLVLFATREEAEAVYPDVEIVKVQVDAAWLEGT